jgi:chromosome segregation ATPase
MVLGLVLLGGVAVSGQNKTPGVDLAGIADTKAMHTAIIRAIDANTHAQIVIARLASQDARVSAAIAQVADAHRQVMEATRLRMDVEAEIRRLTQSMSGQSSEPRAETHAQISERRSELLALRQQEQAKAAQLPKVQQVLAAEQARHSALSGKLDELERSLGLK